MGSSVDESLKELSKLSKALQDPLLDDKHIEAMIRVDKVPVDEALKDLSAIVKLMVVEHQLTQQSLRVISIALEKVSDLERTRRNRMMQRRLRESGHLIRWKFEDLRNCLKLSHFLQLSKKVRNQEHPDGFGNSQEDLTAVSNEDSQIDHEEAKHSAMAKRSILERFRRQAEGRKL